MPSVPNIGARDCSCTHFANFRPVCVLSAGRPPRRSSAAVSGADSNAGRAAPHFRNPAAQVRCYTNAPFYTTLFAGHIVILYGVFAIRVTQLVC